MALSLFVAGCSQAPRLTYDHGAVIRGDLSSRRIALVFTGGSYAEGTGPILNALRDAGITASFFLTGEYLADETNRGLVQRMVSAGHYVGPHSHAHPLYCPWDDRERTLVTEAFFKEDLERNIAELRELGALPPGSPVFFIPPYEWFNADQVRWARDIGVTLFNFTPGSGSNRDWVPEGEKGFVPSARIAADILAYEDRDPHGLNGFILLLHLGSQRADKMHPQVEPLLRELAGRGYRFMHLDDLLAPWTDA